MTNYEFSARDIVVTKKDYLIAFRKKELVHWKSKLWLVALFNVILLYLLIRDDSFVFSTAYLTTAFLGSICVYILIFGIAFLFVQYAAFRFSKNDLCSLAHSLESADEGIEVFSERGNFIHKWSDFKGYLQFTEMILLKRKDNQFILVPMRYFDEKSKDQFTKAVKDNLK